MAKERENRFLKKTQSDNALSQVTSHEEIAETSVLVADLDIDLIEMDENNEFLNGYEDKESIANSMKEIGNKSIISVYKIDTNKFRCFSGHTRLLAAKENGLKKIACCIYKEPSPDEQMKTLILLNTQRKKRPLYVARNIDEYERLLRKKGFKGNMYEKLSEVFGYKKTQISFYKKILTLPKEFQEFCKNESFPFTELLKCNKDFSQEEIEEYSKKIQKHLEENEGYILGSDLKSIFDNNLDKEQTLSSNTNEKTLILKSNTCSVIKIDNTFSKIEKITNQFQDNYQIKDKKKVKEQAIRIKDYIEKIISDCEE